MWGLRREKNYAPEHVAFDGRFSSDDARRLGFFSSDNPPAEGTDVVCFRDNLFMTRGKVVGIDEARTSDGTDGRDAWSRGAWITIESDNGERFHTWAGYLAPAHYANRSYSAICSTEELQASHFCALFYRSYLQGAPAMFRPATRADARNSLQAWLSNLVDAKGVRVEVQPQEQENILRSFDRARDDASISVYTKELIVQRAPVFTDDRGSNYSHYYRALNNTLNHDTEASLRSAMPLISNMIGLILYDGDRKRSHGGGCTAYNGETEAPTQEGMQKLENALRGNSTVRFRQFQSTTLVEAMAQRMAQMSASRRGFLWTIDIPRREGGFWGVRDIQGVECELLFPPYVPFRVKSVDEWGCRLEAVSLCEDCAWVRFVTRLPAELARDLLHGGGPGAAPLRLFRRLAPDSAPAAGQSGDAYPSPAYLKQPSAAKSQRAVGGSDARGDGDSSDGTDMEAAYDPQPLLGLCAPVLTSRPRVAACLATSVDGLQ